LGFKGFYRRKSLAFFEPIFRIVALISNITIFFAIFYFSKQRTQIAATSAINFV